MAQEADDDGDPHGPVFFLSYARARNLEVRHGGPHDPNRFVATLFDDLTEHVDQLVGSPPGIDPGFMDRNQESGVEWVPEVLTAASSCQVFVPLISLGYLQSEWCAMEWDAFTRRPVRHRRQPGSPRTNTAVVPVVWTPLRADSLPAMVRALQFFEPHQSADPGIAQRYLADGVYGLRAGGDSAAYQAVTWRLARRIADVFQEYRVVVPETAPKPAQLRRSFSTRDGVEDG